MSEGWNKCLNFMSFAIYIQYAISSLLVVAWASAAELNQHNLDSIFKIISFAVSVILFTFCFIFILFAIKKWFQARKSSILVSLSYSKQLFEGLKLTSASQFNTSRYIVLRFTLCCIAVFWCTGLYFIKISIYSFVQCCSVVFLWIVRPYENLKDNLCGIISECHYFVLWVLLFFVENEAKWSRVFEIVYLCIIILSNL